MQAARDGAGIALSGGSTPRRTYELAAGLELCWPSAALWWADERCVPPHDPRSNYRLARETLLDELAVPPREVHRIHGERGAEAAAELYDEELRGRTLDFALLGLGEDGHTASLFPNAATLEERERRAVAAAAGAEPFVERVTLTVPALCGTAIVLFLVTGGQKAQAVARALTEPASPDTPASLVRGARTLAILDRAAAARLDI